MRGWANDIADNALDVLNKVEQPRAATADVDPQDAAASLGELSLPAKDGAGLPVSPPRLEQVGFWCSNGTPYLILGHVIHEQDGHTHEPVYRVAASGRQT